MQSVEGEAGLEVTAEVPQEIEVFEHLLFGNGRGLDQVVNDFLRRKVAARVLEQLQRNNGRVQRQLVIRKHVQNVVRVQEHFQQQNGVLFDRRQDFRRQARNAEETGRVADHGRVVQLKAHDAHKILLAL